MEDSYRFNIAVGLLESADYSGFRDAIVKTINNNPSLNASNYQNSLQFNSLRLWAEARGLDRKMLDETINEGLMLTIMLGEFDDARYIMGVTLTPFELSDEQKVTVSNEFSNIPITREAVKSKKLVELSQASPLAILQGLDWSVFEERGITDYESLFADFVARYRFYREPTAE